jgi:hypothetical protein
VSELLVVRPQVVPHNPLQVLTVLGWPQSVMGSESVNGPVHPAVQGQLVYVRMVVLSSWSSQL